MAIDCDCSDANSGLNLGGHGDDCSTGMGVTRNIILLTRTKANGDTNGITIGTDTLNQAFFDGKFRDPSFVDRWLWSPIVDGIDNPIVDDNVETTPSGAIKFLSKGIRQLTLPFYTSQPYKLQKQFQSNACRGLGFLEVDGDGNTQGEYVDGIFNGRKIQSQSFRANVIIPTDGSSPRVDVVFNIDRSAKDSEVDFIANSSMGGYNMADTQPLSDVVITNIVVSTTGMEFDLEQIVGGILNRFPATGLTDSHLDFFNVDSDAVEPIDSLTETTDGHYVAAFTTPISLGEFMEVRGILGVYVQLSYDLKQLIDQTGEAV